MSEFNGTKITDYKDGRDSATGTLARGSTFNNEYNRLYANDNYLKDEIDKLGGASRSTDRTMSSNSDLEFPTVQAAKGYTDDKIAALIGEAPSALDTLNELAAALNDDAGLATTLLAKIEASGQQNLVYNHDFKYFSNQLATIASWYNYMHPDGWVYIDNGTDGKIGYDAGLECCKLQTSSDGSGTRSFKQALHEFADWKKLLQGKLVTLKAFIKGANATVRITDGVSSQSFALQNTGGIEEITLQLAVDSAATELTVHIESATAANIIQIYKVYANRGTYAIESLPCIIQGRIGDISMFGSEVTGPGEFLCDKSALPRATYTRLFSVIGIKYGSGDGSSTFNIPGYKGLVPKGAGNAIINGHTKTGPAFAAEQEDQGHMHAHTQTSSILANGTWYGGAGGSNPDGSTSTTTGPIAVSGYDAVRFGNNTRDSSLGTTFLINFGRTRC